MATFQSWLNDQTVRPDSDPVGWLARLWKSHETDRPRMSSPVSIGRFLEDQADGDEARGHVTEAVRAATVAYRDRALAEPMVTRDGTPANAAAEAMTPEQRAAFDPATGKPRSPVPGHPDPGMSPAGGWPVAVVPSSAWVTHPDASQYGSCGCGWARGLAGRPDSTQDGTPQGTTVVITCAAGHIFEPSKPETLAETTPDFRATAEQAGRDLRGETQPELPLSEIAAEQLMAAVGIPLEPGQVPETADVTAEMAADGTAALQAEVLDQILTAQGMIMHTLSRIARHVGLPPERLDEFVDASLREAEMGEARGTAPLPPGYDGWRAEGQAPADLSSQLYGLAGQPPAPQPPNPPQAYAAWWSQAQYDG